MNSTLALDHSFLALSHPVRRSIVARLARGPATVGEATHGIRISKPAVTKHLKVLEQSGVIRRTVIGRTHRLELEASALDPATEWLAFHRRLWESKFDAVERHLAEEDRRKEQH